MAICARHGFILPNGVGDLQKGERWVSIPYYHQLWTDDLPRYCNVDYVFSSAKSALQVRVPYMVGYDIACQWSINILTRMAESGLPEHLRMEMPTDDLRYVIPKYHFNGHKEKDHSKYNLNLVQGSGLTDFEEVERNWSRHNATAASTREMGPGSRHDTLEDHFAFANFVRCTNLGECGEQKLQSSKD